LKISINGGAYTLVPPSAYTFNPYNATLQTVAAGNTNPLAGQPAFTGADGGSLFGSWGQSQVDLVALGVQPGDTVRLRYDLGMDGCNGLDGWYMDDVNVYACTNTDPTIAVASGGVCSADLVGTMNLSLGDFETPAGRLTLSASSSNTSLVPNSAIVFGGSGANRTVTISPNSRQTGSATVTIQVSDGVSSASVQIQVIVGTNKVDILAGTTGADMIFGLNDPDTINADAGNDLVCGGNGPDVINGGSDDDALYGMRGDETLTGGPGADFFSGGPGSDSATDFNPAEGDSDDGSIP
jgi:Ca2+-binding RTX toxin-like protein